MVYVLRARDMYANYVRVNGLVLWPAEPVLLFVSASGSTRMIKKHDQ